MNTVIKSVLKDCEKCEKKIKCALSGINSPRCIVYHMQSGKTVCYEYKKGDRNDS